MTLSINDIFRNSPSYFSECDVTRDEQSGICRWPKYCGLGMSVADMSWTQFTQDPTTAIRPPSSAEICPRQRPFRDLYTLSIYKTRNFKISKPISTDIPLLRRTLHDKCFLGRYTLSPSFRRGWRLPLPSKSTLVARLHTLHPYTSRPHLRMTSSTTPT